MAQLRQVQHEQQSFLRYCRSQSDSRALVSIDQNDSELYSRAGPFLIHILADNACELDKKHDALEKKIIELRRNQRSS
ncbi:hypothetical protein CQZ93_17950 [Ochrobactrum vermis]|nr:hypothetical protein CQZ93_17950 [Ochrobactrum vermis]